MLVNTTTSLFEFLTDAVKLPVYVKYLLFKVNETDPNNGVADAE
jgi:hypothetical protein